MPCDRTLWCVVLLFLSAASVAQDRTSGSPAGAGADGTTKRCEKRPFELTHSWQKPATRPSRGLISQLDDVTKKMDQEPLCSTLRVRVTPTLQKVENPAWRQHQEIQRRIRTITGDMRWNDFSQMTLRDVISMTETRIGEIKARCDSIDEALRDAEGGEEVLNRLRRENEERPITPDKRARALSAVARLLTRGHPIGRALGIGVDGTQMVYKVQVKLEVRKALDEYIKNNRNAAEELWEVRRGLSADLAQTRAWLQELQALQAELDRIRSQSASRWIWTVQLQATHTAKLHEDLDGRLKSVLKREAAALKGRLNGWEGKLTSKQAGEFEATGMTAIEVTTPFEPLQEWKPNTPQKLTLMVIGFRAARPFPRDPDREGDREEERRQSREDARRGIRPASPR